MATNKAAYLTTIGSPFEVKPSPYPSPHDDQLIIKVHAVAINPVDLMLQSTGPQVFNRSLPAILGYDVSGQVDSIGAAVTRFKPGDYVAGLADGEAFQEHVVLAEHMTIQLSPNVNTIQGAVLPMGVTVATKMLFHPDLLALDLPSQQRVKKNETVLIWGGATSVGSMAIQLAVAAGYDVITTSSPHNFAYAESLGAEIVLDYSSPSVQAELLAAFEGRVCAGAVANGTNDPVLAEGVASACAAVVRKQGQRKVVPCTMMPTWGGKELVEGVECRFVQVLRGDRKLAGRILHDFLPGALEDGRVRAVPEAEVVGSGLESVQVGMDALRRGVSARKIVVTL